MAVNAGARYTGDNGRVYATRFGDPKRDILGQCFRDRTGHWISPRDKVFEFGCGSGRNLLSLSCAERAGFDINEHSRAAAAQAGLRIFERIEDIPKGYWDVVICNHVLEHLETPVRTLEILKSLLSPNGTLILTVPLQGHSLALVPADVDSDHHLYCWNPTTMRNLLDVAGFKVRNIAIRSAACEDRAAPLSHLSWTAFKMAVWAAGIALRRREMTCVANAASS